ncbi:MAG: hypothetical protein AAF676_09260 [Pseudomonadota bacterium]
MGTSEREAREARLAQALRANLRRRKGQARARADETPVDEGKAQPDRGGHGAKRDGEGSRR